MAKIVIFGANSAVAQACARLWTEQGHDLFLISRDAIKLQAQVDDLRIRSQVRIEALAADLGDTKRHDEIYASILQSMGSIDQVFIAHGILGEQTEAEQNFAKTQRILEVNLLSPISLITQATQIMQSNGGGSIAAITSVAGDRGRASNYVYGTSKGALSIFLAGLRHRLANSSITVTDIKLGFVDTPMTASFKKGLLWRSPESVARSIVKSIDKKKAVAYTPGFWRWIMLVIKSIPEKVFHRLKI